MRWRHRGEGWSRTSASTPLPAAVCPPFSGEPQAAALVAAAHSLLARNVTEPFVLTLLNLGETAIPPSVLANLFVRALNAWFTKKGARVQQQVTRRSSFCMPEPNAIHPW